MVNVHNVYNRTVVYNGREYGPRPFDRVSYNGGRGGLNIQPRPEEIAATREAHYAPLPEQRQHRVEAATNRNQFFAANGGRPAQAYVGRPIGAVNNIAVTPREQAFNAHRLAGPNQPAFAGRPGDFNRGAPPNQPAYNNNRPGTSTAAPNPTSPLTTTIAPATSTPAPNPTSRATTTTAPATSTAAPNPTSRATTTIAPETSTAAPSPTNRATTTIAPATSTAAPNLTSRASEPSPTNPRTTPTVPETSTGAPNRTSQINRPTTPLGPA